MKKSAKALGFGKIATRKSPVRKIGLDTTICLSWFRNQQIEKNHRPRILKRKDVFYINYIVFAELMYQIIKDTGKSKEKVRKEIFNFMKRNKINLLKKKNLTDKLSQVENITSQLKNQRKKFKGDPEDSDLKIISIYYVSNMDCIFSSNYKHFK